MTPKAAALYARISLDRYDTRHGVDRQMADARALAARLGWVIAEEYVDNDLSAYSGKARPAFRRMMDDVKSGLRDGIIAGHPDRLTRQPKELEAFIDVCDAARIPVNTVQGGDYDLATASGRMTARVIGAIARHESEHMSERISRALQDQAERGAPLARGHRHYGYEHDGVTIRPDEAAIISELADRCLAGESLTGLTKWLNDSGIPTSTGRGVWRLTTLRRLLSSAYLSGHRDFKGIKLTPGTWPAILTPEQTAAMRAMFAAPERKTQRTPSRYLLTGIARCGRCGEKLVSHVDRTTPAYRCHTHPHNAACGRLQISAEPLEAYVRDLALTALDSPALDDARRTATADDQPSSRLFASIQEAERRLTELGSDYADGLIDRATLHAATTRLRARIEADRQALAATTQDNAVHRYAGRAQELRGAWDSMSNDQRRSIIRAVIESVTIGPGLKGVRRFQPERVTITWRV